MTWEIQRILRIALVVIGTRILNYRRLVLFGMAPYTPDPLTQFLPHFIRDQPGIGKADVFTDDV